MANQNIDETKQASIFSEQTRVMWTGATAKQGVSRSNIKNGGDEKSKDMAEKSLNGADELEFGACVYAASKRIEKKRN